MDLLLQSFGGLGDILRPLWFVFTHGGWIGFVLVVAYILYVMYRGEITGQFLAGQEWVFLNIRVPKLNTASTLAIEEIYTQMHVIYSGLTFYNTYVEGKVQLWYSLELVSLGGKVSFIVRLPKKMRDIVEAAIYSHYPNAEIAEVEDYLKSVSYDPDSSAFDIWGAEFKLTDDQVFPIRTYREFEHPTAEDKIIDPLVPLFESLNKMKPYEMYAIQILIQPIADDDWKPKGDKKAKELMGLKPTSTASFFDILAIPINAFAAFDFFALFKSKTAEPARDPGFQNLTDIEKERVNGIQRKISKPGYLTKMRHLYLAPKDKFDGAKKALIIGAFRALGSSQSNKFKADGVYTATTVDYKISPDLEKAYIDRVVRRRKNELFQAFKDRDIYIGIGQFILNTEELATIYHLPISPEGNVLTRTEAVESKKAPPPPNLPIGEF